jgi:hypothetical protein
VGLLKRIHADLPVGDVFHYVGNPSGQGERMSEIRSWDGKEKRKGQVEPIHPTRWKLLGIWIAVFTVAVGWALHAIGDQQEAQNNVSIALAVNQTKLNNALKILAANQKDLQLSTAKIGQLEKTNCGLKLFLLRARRARWDTYQRNLRAGKPTREDLRAVTGYELILRLYVGGTGVCVAPKSVIIKGRPYAGQDQ